MILHPFKQIVKGLPVIFFGDGFPNSFDVWPMEHDGGIGGTQALFDSAHVFFGYLGECLLIYFAPLLDLFSGFWGDFC